MANPRDIKNWIAQDGCTCACCRAVRSRPISKPVQTPEEVAREVERWRFVMTAA